MNIGWNVRITNDDIVRTGILNCLGNFNRIKNCILIVIDFLIGCLFKLEVWHWNAFHIHMMVFSNVVETIFIFIFFKIVIWLIIYKNSADIISIIGTKMNIAIFMRIHSKFRSNCTIDYFCRD